MGTETDGGVLARAVLGLVGVSVVAAGVVVARRVADTDAVLPYGASAVLVAFAMGIDTLTRTALPLTG